MDVTIQKRMVRQVFKAAQAHPTWVESCFQRVLPIQQKAMNNSLIKPIY